MKSSKNEGPNSWRANELVERARGAEERESGWGAADLFTRERTGGWRNAKLAGRPKGAKG